LAKAQTNDFLPMDYKQEKEKKIVLGRERERKGVLTMREVRLFLFPFVLSCNLVFPTVFSFFSLSRKTSELHAYIYIYKRG
jgi:hypothetical protein